MDGYFLTDICGNGLGSKTKRVAVTFAKSSLLFSSLLFTTDSGWMSLVKTAALLFLFGILSQSRALALLFL